MGSLIDELKQSRPIAPTEPVFLAPEDQQFSLYLTRIMLVVPRQQKIKREGKMIAMVIEELSKIP